MIYPVYAVRDEKTQFMPFLMIEQNDPSAIRQFELMVTQSGTLMGQNPADFTLYKVASFDSDTCNIEPVWPIEFVVNGVNVSA